VGAWARSIIHSGGLRDILGPALSVVPVEALPSSWHRRSPRFRANGVGQVYRDLSIHRLGGLLRGGAVQDHHHRQL